MISLTRQIVKLFPRQNTRCASSSAGSIRQGLRWEGSRHKHLYDAGTEAAAAWFGEEVDRRSWLRYRVSRRKVSIRYTLRRQT